MAVETPGTPSSGGADLKNTNSNYLTYGISNPFVLLLGGAILGMGMLLDKFLAGKFGTIHTGIFQVPSINLISLAINALIMILVLGYLMNCFRELERGNYRMPPISKSNFDPRQGLSAFTVMAVYILIAILILYSTLILTKELVPLFFTMCIIPFLFIFFGLAASILLIFSGWISLAFYANDGDLFLAINPLIGVARSLSHINLLITVIILTFIVGIPLDILSYLNKLVPITEVLSPWARFYALAAAAFIAYDFYRNTDIGKAKKNSTPRDSDT